MKAEFLSRIYEKQEVVPMNEQTGAVQECAPASDRIFNDSPQVALAMAYVPFQRWCTPYEPEVGFERGTMFPALDKPFLGGEAVGRGR